MKYILIMIIFLSGCAWSKVDIGWGIASTVATAGDAYSTTQALKNPDNYEGYSLIMSKHPSNSEVYLFMGISQIATLIVAHLVPSWRPWLLGGKTVINTGCWINNERLE